MDQPEQSEVKQPEIKQEDIEVLTNHGKLPPRGKPVSVSHMRDLGIPVGIKTMTDSLEELKNNPPGIVIGEAVRDVTFIQNYFKEQKLRKRHKYVMGFGVYQQLHYDQARNVKLLKPSSIKFKNVYSPYKGQNLDDKTLVVSRTGGIGDLLFIQPNLRFLKEKYPTCTIKFGCGPQYQSMVETWDCVDYVLDLPYPYIHLQHSHYQAIFEGVIERCTQAHRDNAYRLFTTWLGLNLPDELLVPKQTAKADKVLECTGILENWKIKEKDFIMLQPKSSSPVRSPSPVIWINLVNELTSRGHNVVITDSPRNANGVDKLRGYMRDKEKVFNFCRYSSSLDYTIAMASLCSLGFGPDSAILHIAESLDVPSFGLYGPFPAHIRLGTYKKAGWVEASRECAPCFIHGHNPCEPARLEKTPWSPCYNSLDPKKMADEIERLIENG